MVRSAWNRNKLKKFLSILIAVFIYLINIFDYESTKIYINNNFSNNIFCYHYSYFWKNPILNLQE